MQLQRDRSRIEGERGQFIAEIARARAKISDSELQIIQLEQDFGTECSKNNAIHRVRSLSWSSGWRRRRIRLMRVDIRAPRTGVVHSLAVHTIGGVIGNGETIMSHRPPRRRTNRGSESGTAGHRPDRALGAGGGADHGRQPEDHAGAGRASVSHVSADLTREQASAAVPAQVHYLVRVSLAQTRARSV